MLRRQGGPLTRCCWCRARLRLHYSVTEPWRRFSAAVVVVAALRGSSIAPMLMHQRPFLIAELPDSTQRIRLARRYFGSRATVEHKLACCHLPRIGLCAGRLREARVESSSRRYADPMRLRPYLRLGIAGGGMDADSVQSQSCQFLACQVAE